MFEDSLDSTWSSPLGPPVEKPSDILNRLAKFDSCLCIKVLEVNDATWLIFAENQAECGVYFKEKRVFGDRVIPIDYQARFDSGSLLPILTMIREVHESLPSPSDEPDEMIVSDRVMEVFYRDLNSDIRRFELPVEGHYQVASVLRLERIMGSIQALARRLFQFNFVSVDLHAAITDTPSITISVFELDSGLEHSFTIMRDEDNGFSVMSNTTGGSALDFDDRDSSRDEFERIRDRLRDAGVRQIQTYCAPRLALKGSLMDISYYAAKSDQRRVAMILPELSEESSPARILFDEARKIMRDHHARSSGL